MVADTVEITCAVTDKPGVDEFIDVLVSSTLAERRPVGDRACIAGMLNNASLVVTARHEKKLVGIARSITDFHYACYLSDIAVDRAHQNSGIGKQLIVRTRQQLGAHCKLILLSAPDAADYYPKIGFSQHPGAWVLNKNQPLK
ncbi:MAG: GNAT family N-acetyltransferase [Gammaproteobacteria bacterium]|nr:GNAT family N-acetyltransferase [Gammaproteobacteria bacterium]